MDAEHELHFRQHARLHGFDYRSNRAYFVTIVTGARARVLGEVVGNIVRLSQRGRVVQACWNEIPHHHADVELDAFVVMPNHVHGLLFFVGDVREATQASRLQGGHGA